MAVTVDAPRPRTAARVLLLDPAGRLLLFEGCDPAEAHLRFWFTPGGGVDPGESLVAAARREVLEETGIEVVDLDGPVHERRFLFSFDGVSYDQREEYFVARTAIVDVVTDGFNDVERRSVFGHRWWTLDELRTTAEVVFPRDLVALLETVLDQARR